MALLPLYQGLVPTSVYSSTNCNNLITDDMKSFNNRFDLSSTKVKFQKFKTSSFNYHSYLSLILLQLGLFFIFLVLNILYWSNTVIYICAIISLLSSCLSLLQSVCLVRTKQRNSIHDSLTTNKKHHQHKFSRIQMFQIIISIATLSVIFCLSEKNLNNQQDSHFSSKIKILNNISVFGLLSISLANQILNSLIPYRVILISKIIETVVLLIIRFHFSGNFDIFLFLASIFIGVIQFRHENNQLDLFKYFKTRAAKPQAINAHKNEIEAINYSISSIGHDLKTPIQVIEFILTQNNTNVYIFWGVN